MTARPNNPAKFAAWFVILFIIFYYGNYAYIGITSPGKIYSPFLDQYLNYIRGLRHLLLAASSFILKCLGFDAITNDYDLLVPGHAIIRLAYDCLGLGVMSFFTAFVLAYPRSRAQKIIFLVFGLLAIQLLNVLRFVWLALYWTRKSNELADHHTIFNILIYILIAIALYFWVKADNTVNKQHAANPA